MPPHIPLSDQIDSSLQAIEKSRKDPDQWSISLKIGYKTIFLGVLITLLINLLLFLTSHYWGFIVQFRDYIALFSSGIVTTALVYTAIGLKINYNANVQKLEFDKFKFQFQNESRIDEAHKRKLELSYKITAEWFREGMCSYAENTRKFLEPYKGKITDRASAIKFDGLLEESTDHRKCLLAVLNYFEYIAILIRDELIDENAIMSAFKTVFLDYYRELHVLIEYHQETSYRFYMNYVELALKWRKK